MKNRNVQLSAALIVAFAGLATAQEKAPVTPTPVPAPTAPAAAPEAQPVVPENAPKLEFEELTHEFGVIGDEKEVTTDFKFKNNGKSTLEISNVQGSCGCTVPALDKKKYEPGEEGRVKVIYNPHNRRGKQHTNVTVTSNDPAKNQIVLSVQSEVKPTIMTDPQVAAMGQVERGKEGKATITITTRKADLIPTQITPSDAKIQATIGEKKEAELEGDKVLQFPIELTLASGAEVGPIQTQCTVRTSDPNRTLNFMVLGEVVGQVKVEPQRVTLGGLSPDSPIDSTFRMSARNDKAFKVLSVEEAPTSIAGANQPTDTPKIFSFKIDQDTSVTPNAWTIRLTGKAPANATTFRGDLIVKTDMPGEETVKVPYYGFIRQKPKAPVAPAGQNPSMLVPDR